MTTTLTVARDDHCHDALLVEKSDDSSSFSAFSYAHAGFFDKQDLTTTDDDDSSLSATDSNDEDYSDAHDSVLLHTKNKTSSHPTFTTTRLVLNDQGLELPLEQDASQELGCRLWTAALMLCAHVRRQQNENNNNNHNNNPLLHLSHKRVLEMGAGLGACGFVAAANGAAHVTIGDCGPLSVARLVQTCRAYQKATTATDDDSSNQVVAPKLCDNVTICRHLWEEDLEYLASRQEGRPMDTIRHWSKYGHNEEVVAAVPTLDFEATFDIILGSDLLYFSSQEQPLLAALQLHLSHGPSSVAVILQTMRTNNVSVFARFVEAARGHFDVEVVDVTSQELCGSLYPPGLANETPHTTGYKLLTLRRLQG